MSPPRLKRYWSLPIPALSLLSLNGFGVDVLPYTSRQLPYSGYSTSVSGDIRTVGMAGATTGLADTYVASHDNPAGLAMTLKTGDTHLTSNAIRDENIQSFDQPISRTSAGLAVQTEPWGYGMGTAILHKEDQPYLLGVGGAESRLELQVREYRFSAARLMPFRNLSLGASVRLGVATLAAHPLGAQEIQQTSTNVGIALGGLYRFPERFLLGLSYRAPMTYDFDPQTVSGAAPSAFFQNVEVPGVASAGLGWIPNRFYRMEASLNFVQANRSAALLRDPSSIVGDRYTLQPHAGAAYLIIDFRNVQGTVFTGSYYEVSRLRSRSNRLHFTAGSELKISFINFGFGYDGASGYRNWLASIGIDVFGLAARVGIIPKDVPPDRRGFLPSPFELSEDGLPDSLKENPTRVAGIDPIRAGLDVPKKIEEKFDDATEGGVPGFGKRVLKVLESIPEEIDDEIKEMKRVERKDRNPKQPAPAKTKKRMRKTGE